MHRIRRALLLVAAVLALAVPVTAAADHKRADRSPAIFVVPPDSHAARFVNGQLLGQWWVNVLSLPRDRNPATGTGEPCQRLFGHVVAPVLPGPGTSATCRVRIGTPVYVLGVTSECSDVEEPPFFGADAAAQRACAIRSDRESGVTSARLTLAGRTVELIPRFEAVSPQRKVLLPENDLFGVDARRATFVAHGWAATLVPLRPGLHEVLLEVTGGPADGAGRIVLDVRR